MEANNNAKMREALEYASRVLAKWRQDAPFSAWNEYGYAIDRCRAALAAPPRNCDRFSGETEAMVAFLNEVWLIAVKSLKDDPYDGWTPQMKAKYAQWLLAKGKPEGEKSK